jgi:hypothetical protein
MKATNPKYLTRTYRIKTYDVWGNADDGYEVNDVRSHGAVTIRCKRATHNTGTAHEFVTYHPTPLQLARAANMYGAEWEYQEDGWQATRKSDGYPMGELVLEDDTGDTTQELQP